MSLFFKHLFVSIKRKPYQPIILVLTLTLSIFVTLTSFCLKNALTNEAQLSQEAQYGRADITISLNSQSKARFMFAEEARELLNGRGKVAGAYDIALSLPNTDEVVFGTATDFYEINDIFDIEFTGYGTINKQNLTSSLLISKDYAEKASLKVGDRVDFVLFGENVSYVVQGICPTMLLGKYNVMVDITGVISTLGKKSVFVSALGDSFKPSSTLYIDIENDSDISKCTDLLKGSDSFKEKSFVNVTDFLDSQANVTVLNTAIDISIVLICILAMAVTYCCFYILANERREENYAFLIAGARKNQLNLLQISEVCIYWVLSTLLGVLLAHTLLNPVADFVGLQYAVLSLSRLNILKSASMVLLSALFTVCVFIFASKKESKGSFGNLPIYITLAITALLMVGLFALPIGFSKAVGTLIAVAVLLLIFLANPIMISAIAGLIEKLIRKSKKRAVGFRYAIKNICSLKALHNVSRLSAILVCIIMLTTVVITSSHSNIFVANNLFDGEHVILGATNSCYEKISAREEIKSVEKAYLSTTVLKNNISSTLLSSSDTSLLSSAFAVKEEPNNSECIISKVISKTQSLNVGDKFSINCDNKEIELTVKEIVSSPMCFIYFDCENVGISHNLLIPVKNDGISTNEALSAISQEIAEDVAQIVKTSSLMQEKTATLNIYLNCGDFLLALIVIFALIGLINSLYNSYYSRKNEFELFNISGMSKKEITKLKTFEILTALIFGLVMGVMGTIVILPFMNEAMTLSGTEVLVAFMYK